MDPETFAAKLQKARDALKSAKSNDDQSTLFGGTRATTAEFKREHEVAQTKVKNLESIERQRQAKHIEHQAKQMPGRA